MSAHVRRRLSTLPLMTRPLAERYVLATGLADGAPPSPPPPPPLAFVLRPPSPVVRKTLHRMSESHVACWLKPPSPGYAPPGRVEGVKWPAANA